MNDHISGNSPCPRRTVAAGMTGVLAATAGLCGLLLSAPAQADATATIKVRTQRMSEANLSSRQNGWYATGEHVTLTCSRRGQAVKGFFSFNIPNGGWDNLWYKTSDGDFVADVDVETGTLDVVAPECSAGGGNGAPSQPSGDRAGQALSWARSQMASNPNSAIQCLEFVQQAYGTHFPGATAMAFFNTLSSQGQIHHDVNGIPAGALVFTSDPRFDKGQGHVMLSQGDGTYLTANYYVAPKIRVVPLDSNDPQDRFLGWSYAP